MRILNAVRVGTELLIECFTQPMVKLITGCNLIAEKMKRELDISMEISRHQNAEKVDLGNDIYIYNCRQYCFGLLGLISAVLMLR